ncbi:MAG: alkaline phosphatase family protein [Alphaproteobacteria bacterium]|nr:alkaline phosphatase family protein [Alphaproteobacteria bacterium]
MEMKRAVIVVCDSLRADLITPRDAPFLSEFGQRSARFANHTSVFPSTTRTSAASIATGCLPARHGLLGNTMAIDEGDGLVCLSVGKPDFRDRLHRATGRTLHRPTLAECVSCAGGTVIAISNVSPGAAYFLDPDGFGWVYNPAGSFGPGRRSLPAEEGLAISKGDAGDSVATERFCEEVLRERAPAISLLWLSEPDYTGHHGPLGSPAHRRAIASADTNVSRVAETVMSLDPTGEDILFIVGSDHGMETVAETIDLDGLLIQAGLKSAPRSSEVVVAPNGTSALLYFADPAGPLVGEAARFLATQDWVGRTFVGPDLVSAGLPTGSPMQIAVTLKPDDRTNPHGVQGHSNVVRDPQEPKDNTGFGQHGGLGKNEQSPFLFISGGGFAPGPRHARSSLIDIAPTVLRHLSLPAAGMDGRPLPRHLAEMG